MNVNFVTSLGDEIASKRIRINVLAKGLEDLGHSVLITDKPMQADYNVFTKHRTEDAEMAIACKQKSGKVVFDICDDHFQGSPAGHYLRMCAFADIVTVPTPGLADRVYWYTGITPKIVPDPYENLLKPPRAPKKKRVLWYGHSSNLKALTPLPDEYHLRVLSNMPSEFGEYIPWSLEEQEKQLEWCDVVILPQTDTKKNLSKTHNRATTALRAGRYVVASPWPAEYEIYPIWRGDIEEGLKWAFDNPDNALKAIEKSQQISERFAPDAIAKIWVEACA